MSRTSAQAPVVIVGAGLAGLACAVELEAGGVSCLLLEASDGVGGRVRTDELEGFRLDRGFQVLLTAYPEARRMLDASALDYRSFYPGALVRTGGRFARVTDPTRRPLAGLRGLFSAPGTLRDKLRILKLRRQSRRGSLEDLWARPETTAAQALEELGFGESMQEAFLRPWLRGVFLEPELRTSSRMLAFVVRMFSEGDTVVPAKGMGAISLQLAARLAPRTLRTRAKVKSLEAGAVRLEDGERIEASQIVVAVEGPAACGLLPRLANPGSRMVQCLYFAAERDPVGEPTLVLDGEGSGPVNNLVVMSSVSQLYAPPGASLVAASVLGDPAPSPGRLEPSVRAQLRGWYGRDVDNWRHLRTYRIPHALPERFGPPARNTLDEGVVVAGDWCLQPSIQGALQSGRLAAQAVLARRGMEAAHAS